MSRDQKFKWNFQVLDPLVKRLPLDKWEDRLNEVIAGKTMSSDQSNSSTSSTPSTPSTPNTPSTPSTPSTSSTPIDPNTRRNVDFNLSPSTSLGDISFAAFEDRSLQIPLEVKAVLEKKKEFSSISNNIGEMKNLESKKHINFEELRDTYNKSCSVMVLLFLMNLVIGATRILLYWTWKGKKPDSPDGQINSELCILEKFFQLFKDRRLSVYMPDKDSSVYQTFLKAIEKFKNNAPFWFKVVGVEDMNHHVQAFVDHLLLFVFHNYQRPELKGLSSIWGNCVFVSDHLLNEVDMLIEIFQHEMVHSFFRYYRIAIKESVRDAALELSPSQFVSIHYKGFPVHSGYLYDYIFSGIPIKERQEFPFSLLVEDYEMV